MIDPEKLFTVQELTEEFCEKLQSNARLEMTYDLASCHWCFDLILEGINMHFCDIDFLIAYLRGKLNGD